MRFRLLTLSYNLGFADNRPFHLIGTHGGLLVEPHRRTRVQPWPGERALTARFRADPGAVG
jgi:hypothetical protein